MAKTRQRFFCKVIKEDEQVLIGLQNENSELKKNLANQFDTLKTERNKIQADLSSLRNERNLLNDNLQTVQQERDRIQQFN